MGQTALRKYFVLAAACGSYVFRCSCPSLREPTRTQSAIMSDNTVWMLTSLLLLAAELLSLSTAQENSYTLGKIQHVAS